MGNNDVRDLSSRFYFYKKLKYVLTVRQDEQSQARYRFHQRYLSRLKLIFLVSYIIVIPFLESPNWCVTAVRDSPDFHRGRIVLECNDRGVPFSGNPTLSPVFIACLDFMCLGFFLFFRWYKTLWGQVLRKSRVQNIVMVIAVAISVVDSIVAMVLYTSPFFTDVMRPIVFGSFLHLVRVNVRQFYHDVKDSGTILFSIFLFIACYGIIGFFLFRYKYEGYEYFETIPEATFNMLILITTANFPDVMLPSYNLSYWYMLFFLSYLIIGLYLLMNFLLANVFIKFKMRLDSGKITTLKKTENLLKELFDRFDNGNKGYLNWEETKDFFEVLLEINMRRRRHYVAFLDLIKEMGYEHRAERVEFDRVVDFFIKEDGIERFNELK